MGFEMDIETPMLMVSVGSAFGTINVLTIQTLAGLRALANSILKLADTRFVLIWVMSIEVTTFG